METVFVTLYNFMPTYHSYVSMYYEENSLNRANFERVNLHMH